MEEIFNSAKALYFLQILPIKKADRVGTNETYSFNPFPPRGSPLTSKIVWR